jgi:hypothetical protein
LPSLNVGGFTVGQLGFLDIHRDEVVRMATPQSSELVHCLCTTDLHTAKMVKPEHAWVRFPKCQSGGIETLQHEASLGGLRH